MNAKYIYNLEFPHTLLANIVANTEGQIIRNVRIRSRQWLYQQIHDRMGVGQIKEHGL